MTSHDVVNIVRKKIGTKKVGHTGTLDPIATGVLPICIGKATKIADYIQGEVKEYIAVGEFGKQTDTYDITGTVINESNYIPSRDEIIKYLENNRGSIEQIPPIYSAIKLGGKKLYEYARENIEVEIKPRRITVFESELLDYDEGTFNIRYLCSKGTYIRSLINSLGEDLNTFGTMTELTRTSVGEFKIEDAIGIDEFKNLSLDEIKSKLKSIEDSLNLKKVVVPDFFYERIINGVPFKFKEKPNDFTDDELMVYCNGEFIGIGKYRLRDNYELKINKMLR